MHDKHLRNSTDYGFAQLAAKLWAGVFNFIQSVISWAFIGSIRSSVFPHFEMHSGDLVPSCNSGIYMLYVARNKKKKRKSYVLWISRSIWFNLTHYKYTVSQQSCGGMPKHSIQSEEDSSHLAVAYGLDLPKVSSYSLRIGGASALACRIMLFEIWVVGDP